MSETVIAGRYRLERRLGIGGMSTVQLALDRRLERHVAVKLLAEHLADDPSVRLALPPRGAGRRAARAPQRRAGLRLRPRRGRPAATSSSWSTSPGSRARSCCATAAASTPRRRSTIVAQACRGLDYAHRNGVVHRDVKPGNLLRDRRRRRQARRLRDRQGGRAVRDHAGRLGARHRRLPRRPSRRAARRPGRASDLYSLGVVAYQLLSGRLPYEATSLTELALKQQREPPPPLDELEPATCRRRSPQAVALALALDARGPLRDARRRWSDALRDGAARRSRRAGAPTRSTAATRAIAAPTAAAARDGETRALPVAPQPAAGPAAPAAPPRPPRRAAPAPPAAAHGAARRRVARGLRASRAPCSRARAAGRRRRSRSRSSRPDNTATARVQLRATSSPTTRSRPSQQLQDLIDDNTRVAVAALRRARHGAAPRPHRRRHLGQRAPRRSRRAGRPSAAR